MKTRTKFISNHYIRLITHETNYQNCVNMGIETLIYKLSNIFQSFFFLFRLKTNEKTFYINISYTGIKYINTIILLHINYGESLLKAKTINKVYR